MRWHVRFGSVGVVLFMMSALPGCGGGDATTAPPPAAPKVTVQKPVRRELTDSEEFNGWMEADHSVEVRSRVRGHISKVHFTDGQFVKKGQLLFELDPRPFQAEIDRIKDDQKVFEAQLVAAQKDEARLKELLTKGGASKQQVEKAEADSASLEAQISATKNQIKRQELELEYSKITADIDGRISEAEIGEGNLVNAGGSDPLLTTIVSIDPILVYFNVDGRSLVRYAKTYGIEGEGLAEVLAKLKDRESTFTFAQDGETQFAHTGKLSFGDNRIDPRTGTLQVYGTVENKNGKFLPGARVRVRLPLGKPYSALLVPETAILADQDKRYILIADKQHSARRRNVVLGILSDDGLRAIQPSDKLEEGEKPEEWPVIVDNLQRVRLNEPVEPLEQAAAAGKAGESQ